MAKKKLSKNAKITIVAMTIFVVIIIALIVTFFYYSIVATSPIARKNMLKYHNDDSNYVEVYAKITQPPQKTDGISNMFIGVEFVGEGSEDFKNDSGFYMPQINYDIMVENGAGFENGETVYKFVASPMIWWNGWQPFAVAMYSEDGQTTYLDYETGKSNLLYYMEKVMK